MNVMAGQTAGIQPEEPKGTDQEWSMGPCCLSGLWKRRPHPPVSRERRPPAFADLNEAQAVRQGLGLPTAGGLQRVSLKTRHSHISGLSIHSVCVSESHDLIGRWPAMTPSSPTFRQGLGFGVIRNGLLVFSPTIRLTTRLPHQLPGQGESTWPEPWSASRSQKKLRRLSFDMCWMR